MSIDVENICRTCLSLTEPLLSIYDSSSHSLGGGCIADMLCDFTKIKPKHGDNMPAKVCFTCVSEINRTYSFKLKCEQSNQTLRKFLSNVLPEERETNVKHIDKGVQTILCFKMKKADNISQQGDDRINKDKLLSIKSISLQENMPYEKSRAIDDNNSDAQTQCTIFDLQTNYNELNIKEEVDENTHAIEEYETVYIVNLSPNIEMEETRTVANNRIKETPHTLMSNCPEDAETIGNQSTWQTDHITLQNKRSRKINEIERETGKNCDSQIQDEQLQDENLFEEETIDANDPNYIPDTDDMIEDAFSDANSNPTNNKRKPAGDSHIINITYFCNKCNAGFVRHNSLIYHQKQNTCTGRSYKCKKCEHICSSKESLDAHEKLHALGHTCPNCNRVYLNAELLTEHVLKDHNLRNQCTICKNVYSTPLVLKEHMRTHTGEKPFTCAICDRSFRFRANMIQHAKRHNKDKDYKCDHCSRHFITRSKLFYHKLKHTDNTFSQTEFASSSLYTKHRRKRRARSISSSEHENDDHTRAVKKQFSCSYCDETFTCETDCDTHESNHTEESQYSCYCGRSFVLLSSLRFHFMMFHNNDNNENNEEVHQEQTDSSVQI